MKIPKKDSLCWWCKNCYGGCSWAEDFTPVKGWTAEPTIIRSKDGKRTYPSFKVSQCPEYVKDEKFFTRDGRH